MKIKTWINYLKSFLTINLILYKTKNKIETFFFKPGPNFQKPTKILTKLKKNCKIHTKTFLLKKHLIKPLQNTFCENKNLEKLILKNANLNNHNFKNANPLNYKIIFFQL